MNLLDAIEQSGALRVHNIAKPETTTFTDAELQSFYARVFQAGRESMQLEMSQQEPVAWKYDCYGIPEDSRTPRTLYGQLADELPESNDDWEVSNVQQLTIQPQPPQTNK